MIYTPKIKAAAKIMYDAHSGQVDKGGYPYIMHPIHLAEQLAFEDEIIVALLHDTLEDSPQILNSILAANFSNNILEALDILNRKSSTNQGRTYMEYIKNVGTNRLATLIKLLDLYHNMDESRQIINPDYRPTPSKRYIKAYNYLMNKYCVACDIEEDNSEGLVDKRDIENISNSRIEIDTPNYKGEIFVSIRKFTRGKGNFIAYASGEIGCKHNSYPARKCNTSGHISSHSSMYKRDESGNITANKDVILIFKNIAYNRDIRVLVNVDFIYGKINSVKIADKPNTIPVEVLEE